MENLVRSFLNRIDLTEMDHAYPDCSSKTNSAGVQCCQTCFKEQFFHNNNISYSCIHKQRLYVTRLLPVHVKEIELALRNVPDVFWNGLNGNKLNTLLLGGGPGVESIAVRNVLLRKNITPEKVLFMRSDIEATWDGVAGTIIKHFHPDIADHGYMEESVSYKYGKVLVDLFNTQSVTDKLFNLVSLSYFVSEIPNNKINHIAWLISEKMMRRTVVVINDREQLAIIDKALMLYRALNSYCNIEFAHVAADSCYNKNPDTQDWLNSQIQSKLSEIKDFELACRVSSDIDGTPLFRELKSVLNPWPKSKTQSFRIALVITHDN